MDQLDSERDRKGRLVRKLMLAGGLVMALLAAAASNAAASTWSGNCGWEGTLYLDHPFQYVPAYNSYSAQGHGTCTGVLNGAPYTGPAMVTLAAHMNQPMSCEFGMPINLPERITFGTSPDAAGAAQLDVLVDAAPRVVGDELLHYNGAYNGQGYGTVQWHVQQSDIQSCESPGVLQEDFTSNLSTVTTLYG